MSLGVAACGTLTRTAWTRPEVSIPRRWQTDSAVSVGASYNQSGAPDASRSSSVDTEANPGSDTNIDPWWYAFGDPELNRLVERALAANHDLKTAIVNLRAAQFSVELARANQLPTMSVSAGLSNSHSLRGAPVVSHANSLLASASYVVDLWGSQASSTGASRWEARATEQDERTVKMAVAYQM
ncbi:TolC family protein [Pandoraea thiooxydans]|uniref:TolC family protein n=1 Tax=Pandoraea thiooxydans TaxID=445709 RepID=UPI001F02B1E2|nr:TolC family protein [Pandoraea thiooxydans]